MDLSTTLLAMQRALDLRGAAIRVGAAEYQLGLVLSGRSNAPLGEARRAVEDARRLHLRAARDLHALGGEILAALTAEDAAAWRGDEPVERGEVRVKKKPKPAYTPDPPPVIDWSATREDHARDLRAEFLTTYTHVPLSAPVACGHTYLAAVRRALAAEAELARVTREEE